MLIIHCSKYLKSYSRKQFVFASRGPIYHRPTRPFEARTLNHIKLREREPHPLDLKPLFPRIKSPKVARFPCACRIGAQALAWSGPVTGRRSGGIPSSRESREPTA